MQQVYGLSLSWYPSSLIRFILQGDYVDVDRHVADTQVGQGVLRRRAAQPDRLLRTNPTRRRGPYAASKCTGFTCRSSPLIGVTSIGQAENTTMTSISARKTT